MTEVQRTTLHARYTLIVVSVLIVALAVILESPVADAVFGQERVFLAGPDDYMRAYRAREILTGDALLIRHTNVINAPVGATLHWTAPMDYLLSGVGILLLPAMTATAQLDLVWAWLPVGLGVAYILIMIAMMRRGFGWQAAILMGLLVALSPCFHRVFRLGHPDHHCLIELLLLIALAGWIPRANQDGSPGKPFGTGIMLSGLAMGMAIWVASQAMFFWVALTVGLSYACWFGSPESRLRYAKARFSWNCTTGFVVFVGFFVENWPDLYVMAVDKISLVHLALMAVVFLMPVRAYVARSKEGTQADDSVPEQSTITAGGHSQTNRTIALLTALAAMLVWITIDRGRAFEHVAGETLLVWSKHFSEFQPLYSTTATDWSVQPMHAWLGFVPYALPCLWVFFVFSKRVPLPVRCALGLAAPLVLVLTILQRRWMDHVNVTVTPVVVLGGLELCRSFFCPRPKSLLAPPSRQCKHRRDACATEVSVSRLNPGNHDLSVGWFLAAVVLLGVLVYPSAWGILSRTSEGERSAVAVQRRTDFVAQQINKYEARHQAALRNGETTGRPGTTLARSAILCEDGEGPSLLYWTGLPVVASPYHRALEGILEASRFFAERDPLAARKQLDRLGVRYIVMPPRAHEQLMQFEQIAFGEPPSFGPPTEHLDPFGRVIRQLNYRPGITQTMAYRLVIESGTEVIPGVERIAEINEGATTSDGTPMRTGLLYVVHEIAAPASESPTSRGTLPRSNNRGD